MHSTRARRLTGTHTGRLVLLFALLAGCGRVSSPDVAAAGTAGAAGAPSAEPGGSAGDDAILPAAGSGNASSGGAAGAGEHADAGASFEAAGAAGDGSVIDLPLPPDCVANGHSATDSSCSLSTTCSGTPNAVGCRSTDLGDWQCDCESMHPERTFEIDGAVGLPACAVAAGLCAAPKLNLGEAKCTETPDFPNDDRCGLDRTCRQPVKGELSSGAHAALVQSGRAICGRLASEADAAGQTPFTCSCPGPGGLNGFTVLAEQATGACSSLLDVCMSGKNPSFGSATACTVNAKSATHACDSLQLCGPQLVLDQHATLIDQQTQRELYCDASAGGGAACNCEVTRAEGTSSYTYLGGYGFSVAEVPSAATCDAALCDPSVTVVPSGPAGDCQPTPQDVSASACLYSFTCPVPAKIAGHELTFDALLDVSCAEHAVDHSWWCSCGSGTATAKFELGPTSSSEEACTKAPAGCLARLSLALGLTGGSAMPLPDPLP